MNWNNALKNLIVADEPIILDGGLATQLEAQGCDLNTSLWSAELLLNNPQAIVDAHLAYLKAGAQIIITASYQASIQGFMSKGLTQDKAKQLLSLSIELAEKAVENYQVANPQSDKPLIAASVGPYGAYLADGSEYKGDYGLSGEQLKVFHQQRLKIFDQSQADVLACETIPSLQEAKVLADLLTRTETPAWVCVSCKDGQHINDGTEMREVAKLFIDHPNVFAFGVNCTAIEYVSPLIKEIKGVLKGKSIIVYPNSGEQYDAKTKTWTAGEDSPDLIEKVLEWYQLGAKMIGGCCRVGPADIELIRRSLNVTRT